jgi:hypothetical protein
MSSPLRHIATGVMLLGLAAGPVESQLPLAPGQDRGRTVTPAFEGWYQNPDGTFTLSFGYYNRNLDEVVDIPIGPNNRVEPGGPDQGQPTHFATRRHWGVFTVVVPKDFGTKEIFWTLVNRGQTLSVPGNLKREWAIDAIGGDANGNKPPVIRFSATGPTGQGPRGLTAPPLTARVGEPASITVMATDDGVGSRVPPPAARRGGRGNDEERQGPPLALAWVLHRGPADVKFSDPKPKVSGLDVTATTTVTFPKPGAYMLRVHATDTSGEDGSNQCCWTNGYVKVDVK